MSLYLLSRNAQVEICRPRYPRQHRQIHLEHQQTIEVVGGTAMCSATNSAVVEASIKAMAAAAQAYRLKQEVQFEDAFELSIPGHGRFSGLKRPPSSSKPKVAAHCLPAYAGNLDVMTPGRTGHRQAHDTSNGGFSMSKKLYISDVTLRNAIRYQYSLEDVRAISSVWMRPRWTSVIWLATKKT